MSLCDLRPSYYHVVFTLYNVVVLEKNQTRSTIFKSILVWSNLEKYLIVQPSEWKLDNILPYTIKKISEIELVLRQIF